MAQSPPHHQQAASAAPADLPLNRVVTGDCIEVLRSLPDRSVDLVILDPPYWKIVNEGWDFEWRTKADYVAWADQWLDELGRVIKRSGSMYLFGYTRNLVYLYESIAKREFIFRQDIVLDKGLQSMGGRKTSTYKMFPTVTENLWFFTHDSKPFVKQFLKARQEQMGLTAGEINRRLGVKTNGGGVWSLYTGNNILAQVPTAEMWGRLQEVLEFDLPYSEVGQTFNIEMGHTNVWSDISFRVPSRIHRTQKPEKLIERIIYASSDPGMVVLDPFFGSGTTGVAAEKMGRHYIGIEKDPEMSEKARHRLASVSTKLI